jgi:ribonuclease G
MAKEICISSTPHETRLAILEDDQLAEIYYERENEYTLAGSIYNGRVTRVLPGMQSAFVDVGLERDAFLYVTDFMELEDSEETDELEKAAATGSNKPPREVRHTIAPEAASQAAKSVARGEDRSPRPAPKPEPEARPERPAPDRPRRLTVEALPEPGDEAVTIPESQLNAEQAEYEKDETGPGAKRWRGRRRRRGGRGAAGAPEAQAEVGGSSEVFTEPEPESEPESEQESRTEPVFTPAPRVDHAHAVPAPFVLPGESLSKYGGVPVEETSSAGADVAPPVRPASTFKPATLIETPIVWDGSGLLPGESLSKHRERSPEPAVEVNPEPHGVFSDAPEASAAADAAEGIEEEVLVDEVMESELESAPEPAPVAAPEFLAEGPDEEETEEFEMVEETTELAPEPQVTEAAPLATVAVKTGDYTVETVIEQPSAEEPVASSVTRQDETVADPATVEPSATEPAADADASHRVDPTAPTGFRLFGFGKKSKEEESEPAKAKPAASVSSYAPGSGLIEEEVIEEEEFEAPRHQHRAKGGDHDLDDLEEETLPRHLRTGDLGEMLQEAHLDHRIQLNFDGKNGEDEDEEEEDEGSGGAQPTGGGQQQRDRGGRNRRGRGPQQGAPGGPNKGRTMTRRSAQTSDLPIISDLLKPGQEILVQIAKEPIAKKGARITSHIALPGRFLVFMPTVSHIGVSRKIAADEERQRLKRILVSERGEASGGFIVRTAAEGASEEDLRADLRFLLHLWDEIKTRSDSSKSPALIYHDLSLIERILRDQVSSNFSNIWVDSEENYERIVRFLNRFSPNLVRRVKLYTKETPLFEHFGIQDEISKALRSKVWLKSGGSIVINQTEALVAIDINTGKYVGKSARLEDTIVKTNLDAVPEIVRQIRLRDLGGIIVIDFIDMDERKNRFKVLAALEEALKSDRAPTKVLQFNDFGLVAITRKRVKQSLERTLSVPCPTCQATGMVKSPTTVCNEIYTELRKMKKHFEGADVMLRVNPETVKVLKANNASWLTEFEELVGKNILIKSDATLHPEQFDIQG